MSNNRLFLLTKVYLVVFFFVFGCAATEKIKDDIVGTESGLKRKIAFFPGANQSGRGGGNLGPMISLSLQKYFSNHTASLVITDSEKVRKGLQGIALLPSGYRDNLAVAQVGRLLGLNALFETTLHDLWFTWEKRGIWGFRDEVPFMKVSLGVKIYDIETTASVMNEVFLEEMDLSEMDLSEEMINEDAEMRQYGEELIRKILAQTVSKVGEAAWIRLAEIPWKGFIVGKEDGQYLISAGRDVGLKAGDVLDVIGMEDPIEGIGGEVFLLPGSKIGEIRITEVRSESAVATTIAGEGDFEKSCSLRFGAASRP